MSFEVNTGDFEKKLKAIIKNIDEVEKPKALFATGVTMVNLAERQSPKVPVLTGNLRGAWGIYVDGRVIKKGDRGVAPNGIDAQSYDLTVGFFTPYAARRDREGGKTEGPGYFSGKVAEWARQTPKVLAKMFK